MSEGELVALAVNFAAIVPIDLANDLEDLVHSVLLGEEPASVRRHGFVKQTVDRGGARPVRCHVPGRRARALGVLHRRVDRRRRHVARRAPAQGRRGPDRPGGKGAESHRRNGRPVPHGRGYRGHGSARGCGRVPPDELCAPACEWRDRDGLSRPPGTAEYMSQLLAIARAGATGVASMSAPFSACIAKENSRRCSS